MKVFDAAKKKRSTNYNNIYKAKNVILYFLFEVD